MILCLDYGSRYIGLAMTDPDEKIALRHSVIDQKKTVALAKIQAIITAEKVTNLLVGVPISLSGQDSQQTRRSRKFIASLQQFLSHPIPVEEVDETLTSVEAEQRIKSESGQPVDAHMEAARLMLEWYLRRKE